MLKLLLVDNYDSFTYNLVHYLEQLDCELDLVKNNDEIPELDQYGAVILSPGPGLPNESSHLNRYIELCDSKIPVLGVCLGLQAIGEYLGAKLYNQEEVKHGVQEDISVNQGVLFPNVGSKTVGLYHSWALDENGDFKVTARSQAGIVMAIENEARKLFGLQYHPESILSTDGMEVLKNFINFCIQNNRQ